MSREKTKAELSVEKDRIYLKGTGEHNIEFAKRIMETILQACLQENKHKVIIDISEIKQGEVSSVEKFDYMNHVSQLVKKYVFAGGKPPKFAHLLDPKYLQEGKGYVVVLAKQLNLNMKGFDKKEEAINWLNS